VHTEHLSNVRVGWVLTGWGVAVAVASLVVLVFVAIGVLGEPIADEMAEPAIGVWVLLSVAAGFFAGGLFLGFRSIDAPLLHGLFMGLTSLVAWFALNVMSALLFGDAQWPGLTPAWAATVLLVQFGAAAGGAWVGHVLALRGSVPEPPVAGG
jgi:hypothetical protein